MRQLLRGKGSQRVRGEPGGQLAGTLEARPWGGRGRSGVRSGRALRAVVRRLCLQQCEGGPQSLGGGGRDNSPSHGTPPCCEGTEGAGGGPRARVPLRPVCPLLPPRFSQRRGKGAHAGVPRGLPGGHAWDLSLPLGSRAELQGGPQPRGVSGREGGTGTGRPARCVVT